MAIYYNITSVPVELITLAQAKQQLRIDAIVDHEDIQIEAYISEAREIAENYIGRLIGERNLEVRSSGYISGINSEYTPINAITSIVVKLDSVTNHPLNAANYELVNLSKTERQILYNDVPTDLNYLYTTPVTTILKVGYNESNCPKSLIAAMKLIISRLYEFRTDNAQDKTQASHNIMRAFKAWD